jgi:spore germination protein YaaH
MRFTVLCGIVLYFFLSCRSVPGTEKNDGETGAPITPETEIREEIPVYSEFFGNLPVLSFGEIWGYVVAKREDELDAAFPLSDVGYFGAEIDSYGKLTGVPGRDKLAFFSGRVHLVTACNSRGLAHFALEPGSRTRRQLVADLLEASRNFDGLQIDFELIPPLDGDNFRSFLGELRQGLGGKTLSVALPARTRAIPNDVFDYRKILPLVDRILVMAYDEHWSTSEPGPVASIPWCRDVAAYALETIGPEKLIMGLPFYGRSWGSVNGNRAFYHSGIRRIGRENRVTESHREDGVPTFSYETTMKVTVYYDDDYSLSTRLQMYRGMGVRSVGFWSIGQETPAIWSLLELER